MVTEMVFKAAMYEQMARDIQKLEKRYRGYKDELIEGIIKELSCSSL